MKSTLVKNLSHLRGWSTRRKLIVFLVDDWGTIRIPGRRAREEMISAGVDCDSNRFNRYDTLASPDDLAALFDVLFAAKDSQGNPAVFTALTTVANPDFGKIGEAEFRQYYYEPFHDTLKRYFPGQDVLERWMEGMASGVFHPEFHGREHLNVNRWLRALQKGDTNLTEAFGRQAIGVPPSPSTGTRNYLAAFDYDREEELEEMQERGRDGLRLFGEIMGYRASLFTSSSLIHPLSLEPFLAEQGIRYVDRAKRSEIPRGGGNYRKKMFVLGKSSSSGQLYLTRNCLFEPNAQPGQETVGETLNQIELAFRWRKPAIISSHRVNFVGGIDEDNRNRGLNSLKKLLEKIRRKWEDVEFMTGPGLGEIISKDQAVQ